jgi:hypothetical protein
VLAAHRPKTAIDAFPNNERDRYRTLNGGASPRRNCMLLRPTCNWRRHACLCLIRYLILTSIVAAFGTRQPG